MSDDIGLGDYQGFFLRILKNLEKLNISIEGFSLSHLGYRTESNEKYQTVLRNLKKRSHSFVENAHNGRYIAKLILSEALVLPRNFNVSMIELMPPKENHHYDEGFEHCGVVLGDKFDKFNNEHKSVLTGQQDQGLYCKPTYIRFGDGSRVKFYEYSLKKVVELEGRVFERIGN